MALADFPVEHQAIRLLKRSLESGRLGHAYLFSGEDLDELEELGLALAKTLNCENPPERGDDGVPLDACDQCGSCRRTAEFAHSDVKWVGPESKMRVITRSQIRDLMHTIQLKPNEGAYKVGIISAADRLNTESANAFLKTLEEPPARSVLVLLTTEPYRVLETIVSRCLRLSLARSGRYRLKEDQMAWLTEFSAMAASKGKGLLQRYRLLGRLLDQLSQLRSSVEKEQEAQWSLDRYEDVDPKLKERWIQDMNAAIEAEYRRQRGDLLLGLEFWLRDVWVNVVGGGDDLLSFPDLVDDTGNVAAELTQDEALQNIRVLEETQRWLHSNVQEALTLEVALLKLRLRDHEQKSTKQER